MTAYFDRGFDCNPDSRQIEPRRDFSLLPQTCYQDLPQTRHRPRNPPRTRLPCPPRAVPYEVTIRSCGAATTTFRRKARVDPAPSGETASPAGKSHLLRRYTGKWGERSPPLPFPDTSRIQAPHVPPTRDETEDEFTRKRRRNWARLIARTWLATRRSAHGAERGWKPGPPSPRRCERRPRTT